MFNNLGQLADIMKNAGKIRESIERASETLGEIEVEGTCSRDLVKVRANGRLEIVSVQIDAGLIAGGDKVLIEELIKVAANNALLRAREEAAEKLKSVTGGLNLPGLGGLFGGGS